MRRRFYRPGAVLLAALVALAGIGCMTSVPTARAGGAPVEWDKVEDSADWRSGESTRIQAYCKGTASKALASSAAQERSHGMAMAIGCLKAAVATHLKNYIPPGTLYIYPDILPEDEDIDVQLGKFVAAFFRTYRAIYRGGCAAKGCDASADEATATHVFAAMEGLLWDAISGSQDHGLGPFPRFGTPIAPFSTSPASAPPVQAAWEEKAEAEYRRIHEYCSKKTQDLRESGVTADMVNGGYGMVDCFSEAAILHMTHFIHPAALPEGEDVLTLMKKTATEIYNSHGMVNRNCGVWNNGEGKLCGTIVNVLVVASAIDSMEQILKSAVYEDFRTGTPPLPEYGK